MAEINKRQAKELDESQEQIEAKTKQGVSIEGKSGRDYYGAKYLADRDIPYLEKKDYYSKTGGSNAQTIIPFTDKDLKVIKEKERMQEQMNFDEWIQKTYDIYKDPNTLRLLNEIYPEYFDAREEEIEEMLDIKKRMHMLGLRGPRDKKDLYLLYKYGTDDQFKSVVDQDIGPGKQIPASEYKAGFFNNRKLARQGFTADSAKYRAAEARTERKPGSLKTLSMYTKGPKPKEKIV